MRKQRETGAAIWVDKAVHRMVKVLAAMEGKPAADIYEEAVTSGPVGERLRAVWQRMEGEGERGSGGAS